MDKSKQRFVSTGTGLKIKKSQCASCNHSKGLQCAIYGDKPSKYARVEENNKCPDRKPKK